MPLNEQPLPPAGLTEPLRATATYFPQDHQIVISPDDGREPLVLDGVDSPLRLDRVLSFAGWAVFLEPGHPTPIWKDGQHGTRFARAVCYPRPSDEDDRIADLITRYGSWQVRFGSGPARMGQDNHTYLLAGVDRDALAGDGERVEIALHDPADMLSERVHRVMGLAERLEHRDKVPCVVTLAEVLRGELDHTDRPRQIAQALDLKPWRKVQDTLHGWGTRDGSAAAEALTIYTTDYLGWVLDSYRDLPDGPSHNEARGLYPEPFPAPLERDELDTVGAREMVLAACAAAGVDPQDVPPEWKVMVAGTYLHCHFESWRGVLATEERARRGPLPERLGDHAPGDVAVDRGTAVWNRATGQITITREDGGEPVLLEHGDRAPYLLAETLQTDGWVTYQGDDDSRSGYHWAPLDHESQQAWVVRYPLPPDHREHLHHLLDRYGQWQVEFVGAENPGSDSMLTCTVGETREAWRAGTTRRLDIPDPNLQAAARAKRVHAEAMRVARDRDEPLVLSFAELLRGELDPTDRARQVDQVRDRAPLMAVRAELARLGATDGTSSAAALTAVPDGYRAWILHTFRAWPDGAPDGDAEMVYAEPFTVALAPGSPTPRGAKEVFLAACVACAANPVEFAPSTRAAALHTYLEAHRTAWINHLRRDQTQ